MSAKDKFKQLNEINIDEVATLFMKFFFLSILIGVTLYAYFGVYKPKEKRFIKNSRFAYSIIEKEAKDIYRKNGYIYTLNDKEDKLCLQLAQKYSKKKYNCNIDKRGNMITNVKLPKGISVYAMNSAAQDYAGLIIKDIIIDVDGDKGENAFGKDRVAVTVNSSGRLGGMLSPINCNLEDKKDFELRYSHICPMGVDTNYMNTNIPFGFNLIQIGGREGKSNYVTNNVSFLRADCTGYGSELLGMEDFCEKRSYHWLTACYHEYSCAIEIDMR